jgi:hypothetical protein
MSVATDTSPGGGASAPAGASLDASADRDLPFRAGQRTAARRRAAPLVVGPWLSAQAVNVTRHAEALRPFGIDEFGTGDEAPSQGHLLAVNRLIGTLRDGLMKMTDGVTEATRTVAQGPTVAAMQHMAHVKDRAHTWVRGIEKIWDFYFELFGQRQSRFAPWLLSCDRIALDCYQYAYLGVGTAKSVPAPPPFCYMRTGFSPATYRRGIPLTRLGKQLNPFPLIQLPYHRLVNPWTLGAMLHEVSHNLQTDLGLSRAIPRAIAKRLLDAGLSPSVVGTWARWNRETFADLSGLLLGGPCIVGSLLDILARSPEVMVRFAPRAPHPTPILRAYLNFELLRRMGYPEWARRYQALWQRLYPDPRAGNIPARIVDTLADVIPLVVDTIGFQPFGELGGRRLVQVLRFEDKEQAMIEEAAGRLAQGTDPGVVPARFLIGAARVALERRLASPEAIAKSFYIELARR